MMIAVDTATFRELKQKYQKVKIMPGGSPAIIVDGIVVTRYLGLGEEETEE